MIFFFKFLNVFFFNTIEKQKKNSHTSVPQTNHNAATDFMRMAFFEKVLS